MTNLTMRQRSGFGLLEVLLATAIFIVVIGSMVTLNQMAIRNAVIANHRTQAFNLAEDGLETIRQMRDTNWIDGPQNSSLNSSNRWLAMVHDCESGSSAPIKKDDYAEVARDVVYSLCFDDDVAGDGRYGLRVATAENSAMSLGTGKDSDFVADPGSPSYSRTIRFSIPSENDLKLLNQDEQGKPVAMNGIVPIHTVKVTVTVSWRDFDRDWSVDVSTILTNWKAL